jgi:hypothetical protein
MGGASTINSETMDLKRKISKLEAENAKLAEEANNNKKGALIGEDRNWMSSFGSSSGGLRPGASSGVPVGGIERP